MFRNRTVSLALVGLFVWLAGCYNYTPIEPGEVGYYGKVRVSTMDGEREVIHDPRVEADSLRGKDVSAIPLTQVAEIETISLDVGRTVLSVGSIVFVAVAVVYYVAHCGEGEIC